MRRLPGADIDLSSLLLGHSKGLLKERFLSMALTKIWDIHSTEDSHQGGRQEKQKSSSYLHLSCLEQRPPPQRGWWWSGFLTTAERLGTNLTEFWMSSSVTSTTEQCSSSRGNRSAPPWVTHWSIWAHKKQMFQRLSDRAYCSAWTVLLRLFSSDASSVDQIEPFVLIKHICVAQRSGSLLMTPIFSLMLVSLQKKKKRSLIIAQLVL